jgi:hypothetical protein
MATHDVFDVRCHTLPLKVLVDFIFHEHANRRQLSVAASISLRTLWKQNRQ